MVATSVGLDSLPWFPLITKSAVHRFVCLLGPFHPKSRGWVKLRSADPMDTPKVFYNIYDEPEDLNSMVRGMLQAREIYAQEPQKSLMEEELVPGNQIDTEKAMRAFLRQATRIGQHPVGTCAIGQGPDAVVDPELRVRGVEGLRVADASVMPLLTGGNTNIPCIMIGEKAADLIQGRERIQF
nr:GMC oxidoreductase [Pseudomaricurvus alcaniphilus]